MATRLRIMLISTILILYSFTGILNSQILSDSASLRLLKKGISQVYNYQFSEARKSFNEVLKVYPNHPVRQLSDAMIIYWENYPLLAYSEIRKQFETNLLKSIEICEKNFPPDEEEYLLVNLSARVLLMRFYKDNNLTVPLFPLTATTYQYMLRALHFTSHYKDFYFFAGLFKYYRNAYPERYSEYASLAEHFPSGDRGKGLTELQIAADSSHVLSAESMSVLSGIFEKFENNYQMAASYNKTLFELYPGNPEFREEYIKDLLLTGKYDEAEKLIRASKPDADDPFFRIQINILTAILKEKKYRDYEQAEALYSSGARDMTIFGVYGAEYGAYANFGLSRISSAKNDQHDMRIYRKKANALAVNKNVNFD
ncbi:MAG: tetratricopeptide repeat protein [Bacteroidales bacterium]